MLLRQHAAGSGGKENHRVEPSMTNIIEIIYHIMHCIISDYIISYHASHPQTISCHMLSSLIMAPCVVSCHTISYHVTLHILRSYHITCCHLISWHITGRHPRGVCEASEVNWLQSDPRGAHGGARSHLELKCAIS